MNRHRIYSDEMYKSISNKKHEYPKLPPIHSDTPYEIKEFIPVYGHIQIKRIHDKPAL